MYRRVLQRLASGKLNLKRTEDLGGRNKMVPQCNDLTHELTHAVTSEVVAIIGIELSFFREGQLASSISDKYIPRSCLKHGFGRAGFESPP